VLAWGRKSVGGKNIGWAHAAAAPRLLGEMLRSFVGL
jgi:hypothetical protein